MDFKIAHVYTQGVIDAYDSFSETFSKVADGEIPLDKYKEEVSKKFEELFDKTEKRVNEIQDSFSLCDIHGSIDMVESELHRSDLSKTNKIEIINALDQIRQYLNGNLAKI